MMVKELIALLQKFPQDANVMIDEQGMQSLGNYDLEPITVKLDQYHHELFPDCVDRIGEVVVVLNHYTG